MHIYNVFLKINSIQVRLTYRGKDRDRSPAACNSNINVIKSCVFQKMTLLAVCLITYVAAVQSQCTENSFCKASDAGGTSTNSSILHRPPYFPSCLFLCSQSDNCFATTHVLVTDTCELHDESHGSDCFILHQHPGKTVWYRKPRDRWCLKVNNWRSL